MTRSVLSEGRRRRRSPLVRDLLLYAEVLAPLLVIGLCLIAFVLLLAWVLRP